MFLALSRETNGQLILVNLENITHMRELPASKGGEGQFTQIAFVGGDYTNVLESLIQIRQMITEREMAK